jgi:hypothetical protein
MVQSLPAIRPEDAVGKTGLAEGVAVGLLVGALEGDEVGFLVGDLEGLLVGGLGSP